jgi:hypothetical protein
MFPAADRAFPFDASPWPIALYYLPFALYVFLFTLFDQLGFQGVRKPQPIPTSEISNPESNVGRKRGSSRESVQESRFKKEINAA